MNILDCPCQADGQINIDDVVKELHNMLGGYAKLHGICGAAMMKALAVECGALTASLATDPVQISQMLGGITDAVEHGFNCTDPARNIFFGTYEVELTECGPTQ